MTCANCDYEAVADCDYETVDHPVTCTTGAYTSYTCKDCGYSYNGEAGEPNGHSYIYTPDEAGKHIVTCANCDYEAVADCDYETEDHPATCTTGAYTSYACKDCGYSYDGEAGQPNGHSCIYTPGEAGKHIVTCANCALNEIADCDYETEDHPATCTTGAYTTYTCKDCGYSYDGEAGEPNGHSCIYTPGEAGNHIVTCANCDLNETEAHVDGEPVIENEAAATCDAPGSYDTVVYCERCGAEISRETHTVTKDHTPGAPVKENEVPATCTTDGSYEIVVYCADCGAELSRETKTVEAPGHQWDDGVTTPATCIAAGKTVLTCTACGETMEIPLSVNSNNHTGGTEVRGQVTATKDHDGYTGDTYCKGCGELLQSGRTVKYHDGHCPYCGGEHTGVLGAIITAVHGILWLFRNAFRIG